MPRFPSAKVSECQGFRVPGPPGTQFLNLADLAARRLRFAGRLPWLAFLTLRLFLLLM